MIRRNNKRNERRNRNRNKPSREQAAHMVDGKVKITDSEIQQLKEGTANLTRIKVPDDGSAIEFPLPDCLQMFFNEEGKPMIYRKIEGEGEPANDVPKPITYEDIAKNLYKGNGRIFFWNSDIDFIDNYSRDWDCNALINCMSVAQVKRLMAFNKLQNIAIYFNDGWHPNFNDESKKWFIMSDGNFKYKVGYNTRCMGSGVHFKTKELAEEAARIMGEVSLADLFNPNW